MSLPLKTLQQLPIVFSTSPVSLAWHIKATLLSILPYRRWPQRAPGSLPDMTCSLTHPLWAYGFIPALNASLLLFWLGSSYSAFKAQCGCTCSEKGKRRLKFTRDLVLSSLGLTVKLCSSWCYQHKTRHAEGNVKISLLVMVTMEQGQRTTARTLPRCRCLYI